MSNFDNAVSLMDAALFNEFADQATHSSGATASVVIEDNVSRINDFGEAVVNRYEVTLNNTELEAADNDTLTLDDGRVFTLVSVVAADQGVTTWVAVLD